MTLAIASTMQPVFAVENTNQDEIIVTATRTAQSVDDTMAAVTVITREEIDASMATTLPELLSGYPGIDFAIAGGTGKDTQLFIRGTNDGHSLILIDGVQVGSATTGDSNIQHIPLEQVERIEIVRGTRSSLYGSEAIGGVIHIFTRPGSETLKLYANLEAGSAAHRNLSAGLSNKQGSTRYQLSLSKLETDGIHARADKNLDLDGYVSDSMSLGTDTRISNSARLQLNLLQTEGRNWYDGTTASKDYYTDFVQNTLSANYQHAISDNWNSKLSLGQHKTNKDAFTDDVEGSKYVTSRRSVNWQNDIAISDASLLTVGLDTKVEDITSKSTDSYPTKQRDVTGVFIQEQFQTSLIDINASIRSDQYSDFGTHSTGSLTMGKALNSALRGFVSYGTAFKAPTMNQLFSSVGNQDLKPEEASSTELGLNHRSGTSKTELSLYQTDIKNLIEYDSGPKTYIQTEQANIQGMEFGYSNKLGQWGLGLSASLINPRNSATQTILRRRAQASYKLDLSRQFSRTSVSISLLHQGERYDDADNTTLLEAYSLINLRGSFRISRNMALHARIDNLTDQQYQIRSDYYTQGTSGYLGINYKM